jgi:hypothetical protein
VYNFDWDYLSSVTCRSRDHEGNVYPVNEDGYLGATLRERLADIQDAAIDRCRAESNDPDCQLVDCTPEQ